MNDKTPPGYGGVSVHCGEPDPLTTLPENRNREPFRIVLAPGLWGRRVDVTVQPATVSHSLRSFPNHDAAMAYAEELARVTGWPLHDTAERWA
jgi:hypothetical protein